MDEILLYLLVTIRWAKQHYGTNARHWKQNIWFGRFACTKYRNSLKITPIWMENYTLILKILSIVLIKMISVCALCASRCMNSHSITNKYFRAMFLFSVLFRFIITQTLLWLFTTYWHCLPNKTNHLPVIRL